MKEDWGGLSYTRLSCPNRYTHRRVADWDQKRKAVSSSNLAGDILVIPASSATEERRGYVPGGERDIY